MEVLRYSDLVLDGHSCEVSRAGRRIELTPTEFTLLRYFLLHPRRVVSKPQLLREVWRDDRGQNVNLVETYVSYLRRKLDALGPPLIVTVRQMGYMLEEPKG
jgi:two-component system OmpR family response regulator